MEVLPAPPAAMYPPGALPHVAPRHVTSPRRAPRGFPPSDLYSCYPFDSHTPSRTPTPDDHIVQRSSGVKDSHSSHVTSRPHHVAADLAAHATTLQSVLRGEIPPAYSHLTSLSSSSSSSRSSPFSSSSSSSSSTATSTTTTLPSSSSSHLNNNNTNSLSYRHSDLPPAPSPCPSHHSSLAPSPRPQSHESATSQDSDVQTSPLDLSCKPRTSRKRSAVAAFLTSPQHSASHHSILSGVLSSSLPAKFSINSSPLSSSPTKQHHSTSLSTSPFPSSSEQFHQFSRNSSSSSPTTSASPSSHPMHTFPPSPCDGSQGEEFSLLRNLLSVGKHHLSPGEGSIGGASPQPGSSSSSSSSERGCDSPASESSFPRTPITGTTRVTLAKKNLFPVSARVSDWLVKLVRFAQSIPEFSSLAHDDQVTLVLTAWSRLLLLYMAESNFQFAVTPAHGGNGKVEDREAGPPADTPTMKGVEAVQGFIRKCQQMGVEPKEYEYLRMLVLFNSGSPGLSCPGHVERLTSVVQQLLQQHVRVQRPGDVMHYSRLLMALPALYGFNAQMLEALFCTHVSRGTDMELLLKELLQSDAPSL